MSVQTPGTIRLASIDDIPEGRGREFYVGDRYIALFRHQGQFYAMEDVCPHAGAPRSRVTYLSRKLKFGLDDTFLESVKQELLFTGTAHDE